MRRERLEVMRAADFILRVARATETDRDVVAWMRLT